MKKFLSCTLLVMALSAQAQSTPPAQTVPNPCIGLAGTDLTTCLAKPISCSGGPGQPNSGFPSSVVSASPAALSSPPNMNPASCYGLQGQDYQTCFQKLMANNPSNNGGLAKGNLPPPIPNLPTTNTTSNNSSSTAASTSYWFQSENQGNSGSGQ